MNNSTRPENRQPTVAQQIIDKGEAGLWEQLEAALSKRIETSPSDQACLTRLASILRQRGELECAADIYQRLASFNPADSTIALLEAICSGKPAPARVPTDSITPAPFLRMREFLSPEARHGLLRLFSAKQHTLKPLEISNLDHSQKIQTRQDDSVRIQFGVYCEAELRQVFESLINEHLPSITHALKIESFQPGRHILRLDSTPHNGFGGIHQDVGLGAQLIYLYYFHTHPKQFTGGDLLIHDQHVQDNLPQHDSFTTIRHEDNTLVIFEPHFFHQVTTVKSHVPNLTPRNARLSVCGFIHPVGEC